MLGDAFQNLANASSQENIRLKTYVAYKGGCARWHGRQNVVQLWLELLLAL